MAGETNLLEQAASATQGMIPGQVEGRQQNLISFGPTPLVQPPLIPRFQPPDQPDRQTHFETVGSRKRADRQALLKGISGLVRSGSDYLAAKKQRALTLDIERLMGAQQGIQEAQQILQQDPNNQEAKKALEQNVGIVNDLTKDPKKSKLFQKAFNIDLFGDGKNKKENQALIEAWTNFNKKQQAGDKSALNPIAQRLMASQPARLGLDPQAQAQAMAIKAGLIPKAGEILKANVENFKAYSTAKTSEDRNAAIEKAAQTRANAEKYHADKIVDASNIRVGGMKYAADVRERSERYKANLVATEWEHRINMMRDIATDKSTDEKTKTILGSVSKDITSSVTRLKDLAADNAKIYNTLDKKGTTIIGGIKFDANSPQDAKRLRQMAGRNNAAMRDEQNNLNDSRRQLHTLQTMGLVNLSGDGEDNSNSDGTQDNPLPPPDEDEDQE